MADPDAAFLTRSFNRDEVPTGTVVHPQAARDVKISAKQEGAAKEKLCIPTS
jgi:hypothetical protein